MCKTGFAGLLAKTSFILWYRRGRLNSGAGTGCQRWLATLLMLCLWTPALVSHAQAAERMQLVDSEPRILLNKRVASELDISNYLQVLHDASGTLDIDQIVAAGAKGESGFSPVTDSGIATGLGENIYWVRGSISSSLADGTETGGWLLQIANSHARHAQLFVRQGNGWEATDALPGERFSVFSLPMSPDSAFDFYLRLQVDGMFSIPVKVWNQDAYQQSQRRLLPVWGMLFGAVAALALYNLFIYLSLHEKAYLQLVVRAENNVIHGNMSVLSIYYAQTKTFSNFQ